MRRTLLIIKPDGVNRCLVGEIIKRFENKGIKIIGLKMERLKVYQLKEHYQHHGDKPFYNEILDYMSSIPSVLLVLEGKDVVDVVRKMVGCTCGRDATPGTIRGDYSMSVQTNIVHASETDELAEQEIKRFFKDEELIEYDKLNFNWIYCGSEKEKYKPVQIDRKSEQEEYALEKEKKRQNK